MPPVKDVLPPFPRDSFVAPALVSGRGLQRLDPRALGVFLPTTIDAEVESLQLSGYSAARFERVQARGSYGVRRLVVKHMDVRADWFSRATGDVVGREALFVASSLLESSAARFASPYVAVAPGDGSGVSSLVMDDVGDHLLPDVREPLDAVVEEAILGALAGMHGDHWDRRPTGMPWLMEPIDFVRVMGPGAGAVQGSGSRGIKEAVTEGWRRAMAALPRDVAGSMSRPPSVVAETFEGLPRTLVHGDTKVANFARLPDERICALDWAFVGWAPCTFDLGWYLAVNATRLSRSREDVIGRYRERLEAVLGRTLDETLWDRLEEAGIVCGAFMLLWSKARTAAERGGEWDWWVERLERWARR